MSDSASLEAVYEQQERMETMPEILLADTAYGSQAHVEMSAQMGVELVSPASGNVEKTNGNTVTQTRVGEFSAAEEKKAELNRRRAAQETPEWKREYAKRSGVEGVHEAQDRTTGIKKLKVRGLKAVAMAVFFKVTGWNCHHRCALGHPDPGFMLFKSAANARNERMPPESGGAQQKNHIPHYERQEKIPCRSSVRR